MKALVIGGTGPSGPHIVNGLITSGYEVSVLHGGQHEVDFISPVEHIHTDPHFEETLTEALAGRKFDLTIATYGRVRIIADVMKGKTGHLVTVGAGPVAPPEDPRWGPLGLPVTTNETHPMVDSESAGLKFFYLIYQTEQKVLQGHRDGIYTSTVLRYPTVYGPNAPANPDWSMVRRLLDDRPFVILPDGGRAGGGRGFAANVAHAVLLAAQKPEIAGGQAYNVGDAAQYTQAQILTHMASVLGREVEIIDVPGPIAHEVYRTLGGGKIRQFEVGKLQNELGYTDLVPIDQALTESVEWLVANPLERGGEVEKQLGDPFDYAVEDQLARIYTSAHAEAQALPFQAGSASHMYRHPKKPGEKWEAVAGGLASN